MKKLIVIATAFATISCKQQKAPPVVETAFEKSFPNTTVEKWNKEDDKYEAEFSKDGKPMSATFDTEGNLVETETDIEVSGLPAAITEYVKTNYEGAAIEEAEIIKKGSDTMYELEVKDAELLFDRNGNFLKAEKD
jgi:hypothetical protein